MGRQQREEEVGGETVLNIPVTSRATPVMKLLFSDAKNTHASAISVEIK